MSHETKEGRDLSMWKCAECGSVNTGMQCYSALCLAAAVKPSPLDEALAAWRAVPERDREESMRDIAYGTDPDGAGSLAALALLRAAAVKP